jgi:hypothetical protein
VVDEHSGAEMPKYSALNSRSVPKHSNPGSARTAKVVAQARSAIAQLVTAEQLEAASDEWPANFAVQKQISVSIEPV